MREGGEGGTMGGLGMLLAGCRQEQFLLFPLSPPQAKKKMGLS